MTVLREATVESFEVSLVVTDRAVEHFGARSVSVGKRGAVDVDVRRVRPYVQSSALNVVASASPISKKALPGKAFK